MSEKPEPKAPESEKPKLVLEDPIHREGRIDGLSYQIETGRMPLYDDKQEVAAGVFYMAYTVPSETPRPLMFSFNGGPGSPSLWLHLGAVGPKRVQMQPDGQMPPPPFRLVDNPHTWLHHTDLVFIDPIGTGFSRARTEEEMAKYWGVKADIESVGEFIRLYITRHSRWNSPLYLVGESYGTTRAAGLAGHLVDRVITFNGIVLVSSILNFQTARFSKGNDAPYVLFLPTYTASAFYHKKLERRLQSNLKRTLAEVEKFAMGEYTLALAKGSRLTGKERAHIRSMVSKFTGLREDYVESRDLRINIHAFCKELLRTEKRTVGRLDSRFKGIDANAAGENMEHDPSMSALMPPYNSMFNQYVRTELGYETDLEYSMFGKIWGKWDWGSAGEGHPDTSEALRAAMSKNPYTKVYIASGYYDLATPYFATEYTVDHLGLDPTLRANITTGYYEAGHMMYIHEPSLEQLASEIGTFMRESV